MTYLIIPLLCQLELQRLLPNKCPDYDNKSILEHWGMCHYSQLHFDLDW